MNIPTKVRTNLEKWREDDSTCITKLKGGKQLRQDFVFTEVFREGVQIVTQILEELLLLSWLLDLERFILREILNFVVVIPSIKL